MNVLLCVKTARLLLCGTFRDLHTTTAYFLVLLFWQLDFVAASETSDVSISPSAESHRGSVGAYNYTYYNFVTRRPGASLILLKSDTGDADLYVSRRENKHQPTFEMGNFDLHSTSCGLDYVEIENLTLPVNIGVYGHPSYPLSNYTLAILVTKPGGSLEDLRRWMHEAGISIEDLPDFIEKYAYQDEAEDNGEYANFGDANSFVDVLMSVLKFLFHLVLELLL